MLNISLHAMSMDGPGWYGDGAGNTTEENFSIFSLIQMH